MGGSVPQQKLFSALFGFSTLSRDTGKIISLGGGSFAIFDFSSRTLRRIRDTKMGGQGHLLDDLFEKHCCAFRKGGYKSS